MKKVCYLIMVIIAYVLLSCNAQNKAAKTRNTEDQQEQNEVTVDESENDSDVW
ncbi:MAG: hypothetical protein PVF73_12345 [Bacteroidales bacterium]|jgi:hypothetical protein